MRIYLVLGAFLGLLSVVLGAFAAHSLKSVLPPAMLAAFQTGVEYQFYHAFALIIVGLAGRSVVRDQLYHMAGQAFGVGVLLFSGSLYVLSLTGVSKVGIITPFGGLAFLVGWSCLLLAFWRSEL